MRIVNREIKLSAEERRRFFAGDWPVLAGSGPPPNYLKGTRYALSSRLWFTVANVHRSRKGWWLELQVHDDREERFHLLPAAASFRTNEQGELEDLPPEEEIGYTRNPKRRSIDPLPSVPPKVQTVLEMRSRLESAQRTTSEVERAEEIARKQVKSFSDAVRGIAVRQARLGLDPGPKLAAMLRELEAELEGESEAAA